MILLVTMEDKPLLAIGILLALIIIVGIIAIVLIGQVFRSASEPMLSVPTVATITPTATSSATTSPDLATTINGPITDIDQNKIIYKDSITLTMDAAVGDTKVYVTKDTKIIVGDLLVTRDRLKKGMNIEAQIIPSEGAFEALQIKIV